MDTTRTYASFLVQAQLLLHRAHAVVTHARETQARAQERVKDSREFLRRSLQGARDMRRSIDEGKEGGMGDWTLTEKGPAGLADQRPGEKQIWLFRFQHNDAGGRVRVLATDEQDAWEKLAE